MSAQGHYEKGMEYFAEDQLEQAIEELIRAVEEDPKFGDAVHALTMCYYHHGNFDQALKYGKQFSALEPSNPLAYTSLSMIYNAKGMIEEAEEMGAKARTAEHFGSAD